MVLTLATLATAAMHGAVVGAVAGGVRVGAGDCSLTVCALPAAVQRFLHGESSHVCYWKKVDRRADLRGVRHCASPRLTRCAAHGPEWAAPADMRRQDCTLTVEWTAQKYVGKFDDVDNTALHYDSVCAVELPVELHAKARLFHTLRSLYSPYFLLAAVTNPTYSSCGLPSKFSSPCFR